MDGLDRRILAAVTRRGRRLLTSAELAEAGATRKQTVGRCRRGTLQRVHDGVYLVGAGELTWQERILAGVLAGGDTARASRFSALRLWGLGDFATRTVTVTVAHGTTLRADGVQVHRTRRLVPSSVVETVPVVCVEEALLGVAHALPEKVLHQLVTSAWRRRLTTPRKLLLHLDHHGGGVKGSRKLRRVAGMYEAHDRGPGSEAEADFLFDLYDALDARGIERPVLQHEITVYDGAAKVVCDFAWPQRWKAIEMKGLAAHGDYVVHDEDNEREAAIRDAGWDLDTVTPRSLHARRHRTIARLLRFLDAPNRRRPSTS